MNEHKKVMISALKEVLMLHTNHDAVRNEEDYATLWYGFRKYCKRHPGILTRPTLKLIENRGWMSVAQAQTFCEYAGIRCPK